MGGGAEGRGTEGLDLKIRCGGIHQSFFKPAPAQRSPQSTFSALVDGASLSISCAALLTHWRRKRLSFWACPTLRSAGSKIATA